VASVRKLSDGRWQAQYRAAPGGKVHTKTTRRKVDAVHWLDLQTAALVAGTHVSPKTARTTVEQWCADWLRGYCTRRPSTVRQARTHIAKIVEAFGSMPLSAVRPSHVKAWTARLRTEGYEPSYVYALRARLAQVFSDAVHDGIVPRSPCSRRTSPGQGKQRPYVATTEQVWALHGAMPDRYRAGILLGAFAGLRTAEACGLRVADVDFMRGSVNPAVQYPAEALKTETSRIAIPVPQVLALELAAHVRDYPGSTLLTNELGDQLGPWALERVFRVARAAVDGLPAGFRYHDLRHYLASLLIASGADVKTVQARLRHASAKTTLDTYGHLWPDRDESTKAAVEAAWATRPVESLSNGGGAI
jgi:integrase